MIYNSNNAYKTVKKQIALCLSYDDYLTKFLIFDM